jgi:addiction module HigA family antidote
MSVAAHPGRLLKRELVSRGVSANRLALDLGVPSGRIIDILNARRAITADTAVRLGRYFGNSAQFWLDLQSQYESPWSNANAGARLPAVCGPQTLPDGVHRS